jgi:hypothetical protein
VALLGALRRRWDLAAAAVIGLGLCAAIGVQVAANPSEPLLAATLGYTLWWGSLLGLWVWLVLAWALWLGVAAVAGPSLGQAVRDRISHVSARSRVVVVAAGLLACLGATVAVGAAVATTQRPDSHVYEYAATRSIAAAIERLIPSGTSVNYRTLGTLPLGTQPIEPAIRFFLVRHGDRVLATHSYTRLGAYYELYHRPYRWQVLLVNGQRRLRRLTLVARVRVTDGWGTQILSAWVRRIPPRGSAPRTSTLR